MIRYLPLLFLLLCTSCIQLGGEPQPIRYYLLEPLVNTETPLTTQQVQLELGPIEFPTYLDRPQIVSRDQHNAIIIADHDRWAEPLPENLARTLRENFYKLIGDVQINAAPWNTGTDSSLTIQLTINRFDGIVGQQTDVDIRWTLYSTIDNKEILRQNFIAQLPIGNSYRELVNGLNQALANVSTEIATALCNQIK